MMTGIDAKLQAKNTREMVEYENALKAYRIATIKMRVINEGVDVSKLSQQKLDMIMRILDDMEIVNRDSRMKTSMVQQEANNKITEIQKETNERFTELQKKYQDIIAQFKTESELKIETDAEIKEKGVSQEKIVEIEKAFTEHVKDDEIKEEDVNETKEEDIKGDETKEEDIKGDKIG